MDRYTLDDVSSSGSERSAHLFEQEPVPSDESTIYRKYGKRCFDLFVSSCGLISLLPLFFVIAALIKMNSSGPALFRQIRVGRGRRLFQILKFRTMVEDAERSGPKITPNDDPRLTSIGRWLRKWKLDELPQLWNVFKGDMSFVGPRPEVPIYVAQYTPRQLQVLSVRPGMTDLAALEYRNEGSILLECSDVERLYLKQILPDKLRLSLKYIAEISFFRDLALMALTLGALVKGPR